MEPLFFMKTNLDVYREQRDALLAGMIETLAADERFAAGWLTGGYAGTEVDALSDIDISIVVMDPFSEVLCRRLEQVSPQASPDRTSLFRQFGTPALIHENNNNSIRVLCNRMLALKDEVSDFTGSEPLTPTAEIQELLPLAQEATQQSNILTHNS